MTLAGGQPGDATGSAVTLGGAAITGDAPLGRRMVSARRPHGISLTVPAATAAVVRIRRAG